MGVSRSAEARLTARQQNNKRRCSPVPVRAAARTVNAVHAVRTDRSCRPEEQIGPDLVQMTIADRWISSKQGCASRDHARLLLRCALGGPCTPGGVTGGVSKKKKSAYGTPPCVSHACGLWHQGLTHQGRRLGQAHRANGIGRIRASQALSRWPWARGRTPRASCERRVAREHRPSTDSMGAAMRDHPNTSGVA